MSKIRSKISSIEADDDVVSRALGLHPTSEIDIPHLDMKAQTQKTEPATAKPDDDDRMPAIVTRSRDASLGNGQNYSEDNARWPLFLSLGLSALWLIGSLLTAFNLFDIGNIGSFTPAQLGGLAFFVLFPLLLLSLLYVGLKQLSGLSAQAVRLEQSANALMKVDETVVRRATEMSGVIKGEISNLNADIDLALTRASTLQGVLAEQTGKLGETSLAVEDKTQKITERLATEREALWSISNTFDEQMKMLSETLDKQSENLAMSTRTAEQKIQEARVSVESTAAKINQTAELVRSNTMEAAATMTDNQAEILRLSEQLKARASELDIIYQKHGRDLNAMIAQMRNEQEVLSQSLEERLVKMRDVALSAQVSAERLTDASEAGRQTVTSLSEAAKLSESTIKQRFSEMEEMVQFSNQRAESINEKAARRVQDSLSQTRKEIARIEADMLSLQEKLTQTARKDTAAQAVAPEMSDASDMDADFTPEIELAIPDPRPGPAEQAAPALDNPEKKGFLNLRPAPGASGSSGNETVKDMDVPTRDPDARISGLRPVIDDPVEFVTEAPDLELDVHQEKVEPSDDQTPPPLRRSGDAVERRVMDESASSGWLKGLFGRKLSTDNSAPLTTPAQSPPVAPKSGAQAGLTNPVKLPKSESSGAPQSFLTILSNNGLSPHAIVDDGCVLAAVDTRINEGTKQMSLTVAQRLGEPIEHFSKLIDNDQSIKAQAITFAIEFHHSLSDVSGNADALRTKFETEDGRLFLMCDAALNS
ncbi:MAG: hypothetical protein HKN36_09700 [Hellea sp.]|nr:hypothetical protein [Hellea sp.]